MIMKVITSTMNSTSSLISLTHHLQQPDPLPIVRRRVWGSSYQLHSPSSLNSTLSLYPLTNLSESFYSLTEFNLPILLPIMSHDRHYMNQLHNDQPAILVSIPDEYSVLGHHKHDDHNQVINDNADITEVDHQQNIAQAVVIS